MGKSGQLVELGKRIRQVHRAAGFSQETFALECGIGRSYYGRIERGEVNPAALSMIKIADCLNIEVGELFPPLRQLRKLVAE